MSAFIISLSVPRVVQRSGYHGHHWHPLSAISDLGRQFDPLMK